MSKAKMNKDIPICPGALRILMMKDKKKAQKEWDNLIKSAYGE